MFSKTNVTTKSEFCKHINTHIKKMSDVESDHDQSSKRSRSESESSEHNQKHTKHKSGSQNNQEVGDTEPTFISSEDMATTKKSEINNDLYLKTVNVKDLCTVLSGCCSVPDIQFIQMKFDKHGMHIYAKPQCSPSILSIFFSRNLFQVYNIKGTVARTLTKSRLENLRKKISKDVEYLEITNTQTDPGFTFSGQRTYKIGDSCKFSIHLIANFEPISVVDLSDMKFGWHCLLSSLKLKDNIDFIDEKNEFLSMEIQSHKLIFSGVSDIGVVGEKIEQDTEQNHITQTFSGLYDKKYLNIIGGAKDLNKSITISFNFDDEDTTTPTLFTYSMDQNSPQSHFSLYLLPFVISE
jgi:hypothetical protein